MNKREKKAITDALALLERVKLPSELEYFAAGAMAGLSPYSIVEELSYEIGCAGVEALFQRNNINHYFIAGYQFGWNKASEIEDEVASQGYNSSDGQRKVVNERIFYFSDENFKRKESFMKIMDKALLNYKSDKVDNKLETILK